MAKGKVSKASKRRLFFFGPLSVLLIGYFLYSAVIYTYSIIELERTQKQLDKAMVKLKEEEQELKIEVVRLQDPEYIARYARENYLYSKDGEYIIKLEKNKDEETKTEEDRNYTPYVAIGISGSILLVGYVIYKVRKKDK